MGSSIDQPLVALAGVPNVGKTTVFNQLTGMRQKVGNYAGVTVDKVSGHLRHEGHTVKILDLPGTYNLYPRSEDEQVVFSVLNGFQPKQEVDSVLVIADMSNPERGLFLLTQIIDLGYPAALLLNMEDQARKQGVEVNKVLLGRLLGVPVYSTSAHRNVGISELKSAVVEGKFKTGRHVVDPADLADAEMLKSVADVTEKDNLYAALQILMFRDRDPMIDSGTRARLSELVEKYGFDEARSKTRETELRHERVRDLMDRCIRTVEQDAVAKDYTGALDSVLLHPVAGIFIFLGVLFLMFQLIFTWAEVPMNWIDYGFAKASMWAKEWLPAGPIADLIGEGIIPGLGGVAIFIPQIALLFGFLALLEGSGYMARAVFITDRVMRPLGLNGRSVVPLISGFACAIPAIMAARTIANRRDRLITIFVTPFMSCSARLPVYIILIGLLYPSDGGGVFDARGTALFGMYILGLVAALLSAWLMKLMFRREKGGDLILELPTYRWPSLKTVVITMYEKARTFVVEAGKIILAVSVVLWVLASYGPPGAMDDAVASVAAPADSTVEEASRYRSEVASAELEASYSGALGKFIEPVIKPLGYDWKIGIALITSFAAREVFVSTIATLYSIGADEDDMQTIREMLADERNPDTGEPVFTPPVIWSLLVFYAFAMQCMSTVAVVRRETKSWKWPLAQLVYMTLLAYVAAYGVYHLLS